MNECFYYILHLYDIYIYILYIFIYVYLLLSTYLPTYSTIMLLEVAFPLFLDRSGEKSEWRPSKASSGPPGFAPWGSSNLDYMSVPKIVGFYPQNGW